MPMQKSVAAAVEELRAFGLRYPGAHLKSPWPGHLDLAVKEKTFAFLSAPGKPFSISCKLPRSNALALELPFTEPTPYGLGKSGWVSARVPAGHTIPLEVYKAWIDESYRALAPKKLVASLAEQFARGVRDGSAQPAKRPAVSKARTRARTRRSQRVPPRRKNK